MKRRTLLGAVGGLFSAIAGYFVLFKAGFITIFMPPPTIPKKSVVVRNSGDEVEQVTLTISQSNSPADEPLLEAQFRLDVGEHRIFEDVLEASETYRVSVTTDSGLQTEETHTMCNIREDCEIFATIYEGRVNFTYPIS